MKIKNQAKVDELLASGNWEWDSEGREGGINEGQINFTKDAKTYYDCETDEITTI